MFNAGTRKISVFLYIYIFLSDIYLYFYIYIFYIKYFSVENRNVSKGHGCPHLEKLKRKLLTPSWMRTETDRWMDRGNSICPFHHSSNGRGIKKSTLSGARKKMKLYLWQYNSQSVEECWGVPVLLSILLTPARKTFSPSL